MMDASLAFILLGALAGGTAGFLLTWWFARKAPPLESFFMRVLRMENKSSRIDTRLMLHELHRKVDEISSKVQRMDQELKEVQELVGWAGNSKAAAGDKNKYLKERAGFTVQQPKTKKEGELAGEYRQQERIFLLYERGYSTYEIARELNLGRGEVELVLSLKEKPSWLINKEEEKNE